MKNDILKILDIYGLKPSLRRDLTLFDSSCLGLAYTKLMKDRFGVRYNALGSLDIGGDYTSLVNNSFIAQELERIFIKGESYIWKKVIPECEKIFRETIKETEDFLKKGVGLSEKLNFLIYITPLHFTEVALVNGFMRYFEEKGIENYSVEFIERIGQARNRLAGRYHWFSEVFRKYANQYEKKNHIPIDTLRYLTISELKDAINNKKISLEKVKERKKAYFYYFLSDKNEEGVITGKEVKKMNYLLSIGVKRPDIINGKPIFGGVVRGRVLNIGNNLSKKKIGGGFVLVAVMTYPKDILFIKDAKAIITDEGGVLSHASIISRELKIPCIVGTKIATKVLKNGDLVEIDANNGIVKILKRK